VNGRHLGVSKDNPGRFSVTKLEPVLADLHERLADVVIEQLTFLLLADEVISRAVFRSASRQRMPPKRRANRSTRSCFRKGCGGGARAKTPRAPHLGGARA
jgi:hypothetical protein